MAYAGYREHFIGGTLKERRARKEEKFNDLLNFLVKETYSDTATLAQLLGVSKQTTTAALKNLVDKELVMGVIIPVGGTKYWGITRRGILFAEQTIRGIGDPANRKHFVPSMFNPVTLRHKLLVQKAIIYKEQISKELFNNEVVDAGQLNFENPYIFLLRSDVKQTTNFSKEKNKEKTVVPDSIFTLSKTSKEILAAAVEVELSIKAKARYKAIFTAHWRHRQKSLYGGVIYVFETKKIAENFRENILNQLIETTLEGDKFIEFLKNRVRLTSFEWLERAS